MKLTVNALVRYGKISIKDLLNGSSDNRSSLINRFKFPILPETNGHVKVSGYDINYSRINELYYIQNEIFSEHVYEVALPDTPFIIDAGANIGLASIYLSREHPGAEILAFEPGPAYKYLVNNINNNNIKNVKIINAAVSDKCGNVSMEIKDGDTLSASIKENRTSEVSVQCVTLSSQINKKVDLLKIDVEGSEINVMNELILSGKISMIDKIIMEYHYNDPAKMCTILEEQGFKCMFKNNDPALLKVDEYQYIINAVR